MAGTFRVHRNGCFMLKAGDLGSRLAYVRRDSHVLLAISGRFSFRRRGCGVFLALSHQRVRSSKIKDVCCYVIRDLKALDTLFFASTDEEIKRQRMSLFIYYDSGGEWVVLVGRAFPRGFRGRISKGRWGEDGSIFCYKRYHFVFPHSCRRPCSVSRLRMRELLLPPC